MVQTIEHPAHIPTTGAVEVTQSAASRDEVPEDLLLAEDAAEGHELPQSLFVSHMATYPAVAAMVGFMASFPVIKVFASNAVPLAMAWRKRQQSQALDRLRPVVQRADKWGDEVLTSMDKRFPQLKTAQPDEVVEMAKRPVKNARKAASVYGSAAHEFVSKRVVNPAKRATRTARSGYTRIYDNNGKPILRSRLDPIILPLNNRVEELIVDYIPEHRDMVKEPVTNELSRTWRLSKVAAKKARPVVRKQFYTITKLPGETRGHVVKVYATKSAKYQKDGATQTRRARILATLSTIKHLSQEGTRVLRKRLNTPQNKTQAQLDEISHDMAHIPPEERDAVDELVRYLRNEGTTTTTTPSHAPSLRGLDERQDPHLFADELFTNTTSTGTSAVDDDGTSTITTTTVPAQRFRQG